MATVQRFFRPGQYLFKEGEASRSMFLIKKGTVSIRKMKGPAFVEIARIYSNEVLGELSFFDRLPRSAAAIALTEVEALEIQFAALDKVYKAVPEYMKTIIAAIADRLRKANDMIRRLQKNVVTEAGVEEQIKGDELSAEDVLAATANIDGSSGNSSGAGSSGRERTNEEIDAETLAAIDAAVAKDEADNRG